jgi:hypothetical protein
MSNTTQNAPASEQSPSCTAFDHTRYIATGPYAAVAIAVRDHQRTAADASVLIFDDASGRQIDFDLRGTDQEIGERIAGQFGAGPTPGPRAVGRPKLGVISREVTLLPQQWEWLAAQSGGASSTLRLLVETARRATPTPKEQQRQRQERAYSFMSAMAGNLPNFEDASRALFANNTEALHRLIAGWPEDIVKHINRLGGDAAVQEQA